MDLTQLKQCSLEQLEELYVQPRSLAIPVGRFRGVHLRRVDQPGARHAGFAVTFGFSLVPFGVDFDNRRWFFFDPRLAAGRFTPIPGPSMWRGTDTIGLHYEASRLPLAIRRVLYDEVKALSDDLYLGFGGLRAERGTGDHFFFALQRMA